MKPITVCILTVSDRSFQKLRDDISGPKLRSFIEQKGWQILTMKIVPDEQIEIQRVLLKWCTQPEPPDLILTSGGTGFAPRDVTPEATRQVIEKEAPGMVEFMRFKALEASPKAMLSRGITGICKNSIIINLPGSPKAALENIAVIVDILPHAVSLLRGEQEAESHHL